jgi:hypothetical protein
MDVSVSMVCVTTYIHSNIIYYLLFHTHPPPTIKYQTTKQPKKPTMETVLAINLYIAVTIYTETLANRKKGGFPPECLQGEGDHIEAFAHGNPRCNLGAVNTVFFISTTLILYALISILIVNQINLRAKYAQAISTFAFVLTLISLVVSAATMSDIVGSSMNAIEPVSHHVTHELLTFVFKDFTKKLVVSIAMVVIYVFIAIILIGIQDLPTFAQFVQPQLDLANQLSLLILALNGTMITKN